SDVPFAVQGDRQLAQATTGKPIGSDVGLKSFSPDSDGTTGEKPRYLRPAEKPVKRLQRCVSKKPKRAQNRRRAMQHLATGDLKASRQWKDCAAKAESRGGEIARLPCLRRPEDGRPGEASPAGQEDQ